MNNRFCSYIPASAKWLNCPKIAKRKKELIRAVFEKKKKKKTNKQRGESESQQRLGDVSGVARTSAFSSAPLASLASLRWMRPRWERETNEINGMAFAGMPASFPERNEGELFPARCGLNLPPFLFAPAQPSVLRRLLVWVAPRAYKDCCINENDRRMQNYRRAAFEGYLWTRTDSSAFFRIDLAITTCQCLLS